MNGSVPKESQMCEIGGPLLYRDQIQRFRDQFTAWTPFETQGWLSWSQEKRFVRDPNVGYQKSEVSLVSTA